MILLECLWPGLAAALTLGLAVGWIAVPGRGVPLALTALVAALGAAALWAPLPGRPAFWVESAAAVLALYLAGCAAGFSARRGAGPRR